MNLRDYQQEAVSYLCQNHTAFIVAPAGSGKTVIGAAAIQRACTGLARVFWLVNTREQVDQAVASLQKFPCAVDLEIDVQCVAANPDVSDADLVIFDEAHHAPAETWRAVMSGVHPSCRLWGLSATPWHDKEPERNAFLVKAFKNFFEIEAERIREGGHLCDGRVIFHDLDEPRQFDDAIQALAEPEFKRRYGKQWAFDDVEEMPDAVLEYRQQCLWRFTPPFVRDNPKRNQEIVDTVQMDCSSGEYVLVLVGSIEHGKKLMEACDPWGHLVHSKIPKKQRAGMIEAARSGDIRCLIATSLADEGLDIPRLSRVIMACGGRSSTKLTQRIGRVLRPFGNKTVGVCHDFLDRGAALANAQAWSRYHKYQELGYSVEIV